MAVGPISRWYRTAVLLVKDRFGRMLRRPFTDILPRYEDIILPDNGVYIVREQDHWDQLSQQFYGDPDLWHALLEFNQVIDPFDELVQGRDLIVPSRNAVFLDYLNFEDSTDDEDLDGGEVV